MTLTSTTTRLVFSGDGSTVSFSISFNFWSDGDITATLSDSNGVETTWVRGTQYTLTGGSGSTGTLTVITSPTDYTPQNNETLVILGTIPLTQPTALTSGGAFPSGSVEQQFDQLVRQVQQMSERLDRAILLNITTTESGHDIANLKDAAAKFAQVNDAEDGFQFATVTSSGTITDPVPIANGGTGSTSAATALTALAAAGTGIVNTFTKTQGWAKGGDLTSATALVIGTDGNYYDVTGTTTITSMTVSAGVGLFALQFDDALTLTDGSALDLGGANIVTAAGDRALFYVRASNDVTLVSPWMTEGIPPLAFATQAQQETGTVTNTTVTPGRQQFHQSSAKAWGLITLVSGTPALTTSYNISGITDTSAGIVAVTIDTDMSSGNYAIVTASWDAAAVQFLTNPTARAAGSFTLRHFTNAGAGGADPADNSGYMFACFGDQ